MAVFRDRLVELGLKYTKQRRVIAEVFFSVDAHLTLAELHQRSLVKAPSIGYATVYRTMRLMVESGLAHEHKFGEGVVRYEPAGEHHDHMICHDCGRIMEYEDERVEAIQHEVAAGLGFRVIGHRHEIYVQCLTVDCTYRESSTE
ncbi:MAG: transcriptional repressor [Rhodobacterales bacterium]|nr:transcriptional repressor [Rhodobacterales bacterium]